MKILKTLLCAILAAVSLEHFAKAMTHAVGSRMVNGPESRVFAESAAIDMLVCSLFLLALVKYY